MGERTRSVVVAGRKVHRVAADTGGAFDLYVAPASGGAARKMTSLDGDERWPSWTRDGRLVFSHRPAGGRWQVYAVAADGTGTPAKLTRDAASEWQAQVSPDGRRLVFMSDRDLEAGDEADVFVRELAGESPREVRVTRGGGAERFRVGAGQYTRVAWPRGRALARGHLFRSCRLNRLKVAAMPRNPVARAADHRAGRLLGAAAVQPPRCQWCWRRVRQEPRPGRPTDRRC